MSKNIHATQDWVRDNVSIKPIVSGELISLSDSTETPLQSMKIFGKTKQFTTTGKNKLPYPYLYTTITKNGVTFTDNGDGSITLNGTATADASFFFTTNGNFLEAGKTYCIVTEISNVKTVMSYKDENGQTKYIGDNMATSVVWSENYTLGTIYMFVPNGTTANNTVYPIIVEGDSYDGIWEPYTGGIPSPNPNYPQELVSVGDSGSTTEYVMGGNLLPYPYVNTTKTTNGITYKDNGDGSVSVSGTSTGSYAEMILMSSTSHVPFVAGKTYKLINNDESIPLLISYLNEGGKIQYISATAFTWKDEYTFRNIFLSIAGAGKTVSGTVKPMLCTADTSDDTWEPYKSQSLTIPTPNGLPGTPVSSGGNYTDSNGQQYVCDEVDFERGVYVQHIGEYRNTGEPMSMYSAKAGGNGITYWNQYIGVTNLAPGNYRILSNAFRDSIIFGDYRNVPYTCIFNVSEVNEVRHAYLYFSILTSDTEYGTTYTKEKEAISAWLAKTFSEDNPLIVRYQLAEPIETPLTEEEIQAYKALHTNYPNTTIYNSDGAGAEVEYVADTKNYIDNKIAELQANILSVAK